MTSRDQSNDLNSKYNEFIIKLANGFLEKIDIEILDWDTRVLGLRTARIGDNQSVGEVPLNYYRPLVAELHRLGLEYVTVRRSQSDWSRIHAFEAAGFHVVDGILLFQKILANESVAAKSAADIRQATEQDSESVSAVAIQAFKISRFHDDPLLSTEQVHRVYGEWARNCCSAKSSEQSVWMVEEGRQAVAFVTCKSHAGVGTIGLIGVAPGHAGKGLGARLMDKASDWFVQQGCRKICVQTQTANLPALKLYNKLGFEPALASVTLRWAASQSTAAPKGPQ